MQRVILITTELEANAQNYLEYLTGLTESYPVILKHFDNPISIPKWLKEQNLQVNISKDKDWWNIISEMNELQVTEYTRIMLDNARIHNIH